MTSIIFSFARMNPPTLGHRKLVSKVNQLANPLIDVWDPQRTHEKLIVLSASHGDAKNPLDPIRKMIYATSIAGACNYQIAEPDRPSIVHNLAMLHSWGVTDMTLVCGSDRVTEYENLLKKYNGMVVSNPMLFFDFERFRVESSGERDADNPVSATLVREACAGMNYKEFLGLYPGVDPVTLYHLYGELTKNLSSINSASKRRVAQHETGREEEEGEQARR